MVMHRASKGQLVAIALLLSASAVPAHEGSIDSKRTEIRADKLNRSAPTIEKLRLLAERDPNYERCATVCQQRIDDALSNCPGAREVQRPSDTSPPPPRCKRNAVEEFERCLQTCPPPPASLG